MPTKQNSTLLAIPILTWDALELNFASPRHTDGIVITGPISENMAEAVQICSDAVPSPKLIILAGTDARSVRHLCRQRCTQQVIFG